jgi:hypothetical protein
MFYGVPWKSVTWVVAGEDVVGVNLPKDVMVERAKNMAEVEHEFVQGTCEGKLSRLGIDEAPKRSSLAYANEHRSWGLYQNLFFLLTQKQGR